MLGPLSAGSCSGPAPLRANPRPKLGTAAQSARLQRRRNGLEEQPCVRGQGRQGGDTPSPRSGAAERSHLAPEARGGDPEEPPRAPGQERQLGGAMQGAVAEQAHEGLEELSHVEGQER